MHSTLPSSLARLRQPSRATSKNGLFIALGTITKRYVWANAGLAIIAIAMPARRSFLIGFIAVLHILTPILKTFCSGERIDGTFVVHPDSNLTTCANVSGRPARPG